MENVPLKEFLEFGIRKCLVVLFVFVSIVSFGQAQPENIQIQGGANAKIEYVNNQVAWLRLYLDAEIKAIREAVDKVEATNRQKFESQNEWRQQFKDQTGTFLTRRELYGAMGTVMGLISTLALFIYNYIKKEKKIANGH